MSNIIDDYKNAIRTVYGNNVADNLDIQIKDGWYYVKFNQLPENGGESSLRYRKTQLQTTIANLKAKAQNQG